MAGTHAVGLDFGTSSVRAVIVNTATGEQVATCVYEYPGGDGGIVLDPANPDVARQDPQLYVDGVEHAMRGALAVARKSGVLPAEIAGIGVDTTGSTPIPLDERGMPLGLQPSWAGRLEALVWLWKDHSSHAEAREITALAARTQPQYLAKCGGAYSSEWFWSKILRCARTAPDVFNAAHTWAEHADWMPALLTGTTSSGRLRRGICAAGHKGLFHASWGGYPDEEFLGSLDPGLARIRRTLPDEASHIGVRAGGLTAEWAARTGLPVDTAVAVGALDAHMGAVGSGIGPGTMVKIIGTSTCDMMVSPVEKGVPDIPGVCGIVPESILPGYDGIEAGQSAVGDIFNWLVSRVAPGSMSHEELTAGAERLAPGSSGLLALDWHNGNRTVLVDPRLTGLIIGMTLHTTPAEIYRALVEATAFGARVIIERIEAYGLTVKRVVNCGGISDRNPLVMQIYADVLGRPIEISRSTQTCALGAAMAGAVVGGAHPDFAAAVNSMTGVRDRRFVPDSASVAVYDRLYTLYRRLHDAFGPRDAPQGDIMKELLNIRDQQRA